ncbi:spore germination protein GerPC [Bacillus timonensis]|uniref:spore germination protein GerPC n=1 Tax=Bacillus timonensis TaxID=1033734 RepID=UPI000287E8C0|nr:spore germination protein GerPC [Bacillus timonensis]
MYPYHHCVSSSYIQNLYQYIQQQNVRINQLEQSLQQLQTEIGELKKQPSTHIEKVEYKFDQLKVETLEGTLNIGLNPLNGEPIEDFSVAQGKMNIPDIRHVHKELLGEIQDNIDEYLSNEGPVLIEGIANQERTDIEEGHSGFIIEDIQKQIPDRIVHYLGQYHGELQNPSREAEVYQNIINHIKNDIKNSVTGYIQNLPKNTKRENET